MLEYLLRERVADEVGAGSEVDRDLVRRTIGEDSAYLFSKVLISRRRKCGNEECHNQASLG